MPESGLKTCPIKKPAEDWRAQSKLRCRLWLEGVLDLEPYLPATVDGLRVVQESASICQNGIGLRRAGNRIAQAEVRVVEDVEGFSAEFESMGFKSMDLEPAADGHRVVDRPGHDERVASQVSDSWLNQEVDRVCGNRIQCTRGFKRLAVIQRADSTADELAVNRPAVQRSRRVAQVGPVIRGP